nr:unnamed protein product [Callosobruchus chinensis]
MIDCTHIEIKKPPLHDDEYIKCKRYHSINVQATCNADEWFTSVDASWPGSVHDSRIWSNSEICNIAKRKFQRSNALLLGDEGYGIAPWLMVPFRNPNTSAEHAYNHLFTKERAMEKRGRKSGRRLKFTQALLEESQARIDKGERFVAASLGVNECSLRKRL